jgi:hypothetical protein
MTAFGLASLLLLPLPGMDAPAALAAPPAPRSDAAPAAEGLAAIGDVHGDYEAFTRLLERLGLIDASGRWSGGRRHLVQTGDILDRGAESTRVLELVMRLEEEAAAAGGKVTVLLGNHELMNLTGDFQDVAPREVGGFAALEDPATRRSRRERLLRLIGSGSPLLSSDLYRRISKQIDSRTFDLHFPRGYFAYEHAYSPKGRYGRWLIERPALLRQDGILFLHGGLSLRFAVLPLEEINRGVKTSLKEYFRLVEALEERGAFDAALGSAVLRMLVRAERAAGGPAAELSGLFRRLEELFDGPAFAADGPLWYRGLALGDEDALWGTVERILSLQGAQRMVIGHTPHDSLTIQGRFGNRVLLIDTGLNQAFFGGLPSALILSPAGEVEVFE